MAAAVEDHLGQLELLCDGTVLVVLEHERLGDLVPGQRQVALRMLTNSSIPTLREIETLVGYLLRALAEERHREAPAKLLALRCNSLVRAAEHVLGLHAPPSVVDPLNASVHCQPSITLAPSSTMRSS